MAGEKYWKISHVVMVITSENIGFITSGRRPRVMFQYIFTSDDHNHK